MREIKFRAWHKEAKEMIYFDNPAFNVEYRLFCLEMTNDRDDLPGAYGKLKPGDAVASWGGDTEDIKFWEVMQFTGLKDKNGKEIYEGDVLRDGRGQVGHVLWAHNSWLIEWMVRDYEGKLTYEKMFDDCFGYGEVIGNIYGNPELVETNQ